jgi:hypothetical protein
MHEELFLAAVPEFPASGLCQCCIMLKAHGALNARIIRYSQHLMLDDMLPYQGTIGFHALISRTRRCQAVLSLANIHQARIFWILLIPDLLGIHQVIAFGTKLHRRLSIIIGRHFGSQWPHSQTRRVSLAPFQGRFGLGSRSAFCPPGVARPGYIVAPGSGK